MLHISDKEILDILSAEGFLSPRDHKTVLAKASRQRERLKQRQSLRGVGALGQVQIEHPVTIVDVLASLQLPLPGSNAGVLDEERIMSTIARHLNIAFRKIDPLKLDLDVVTKTIPRLFALKHLVVPVDITDGRLEVVMYDPTDASVLEDIRRVTTLEVTAAMGTKADILKIIGEFFGFKSS
ncbi:MAG: hypothetical protein DRH10_07195, partial [Deltaproteobacteria bacterium]